VSMSRLSVDSAESRSQGPCSVSVDYNLSDSAVNNTAKSDMAVSMKLPSFDLMVSRTSMSFDSAVSTTLPDFDSAVSATPVCFMSIMIYLTK
jgi:hypothetical protein